MGKRDGGLDFEVFGYVLDLESPLPRYSIENIAISCVYGVGMTSDMGYLRIYSNSKENWLRSFVKNLYGL